MAPAAGHRTASGPASTEEHQVAASNSTLNRFLGGRQPSWMTGAKPVKPTPRPLNQPAKHPRPPELPHPRFSRPRQPAAPSPSFATQNAPRPPQQVSFPQQTHLQRPSPLAAPAQTSTTILAAPTVLPSPDPSDEPSPAVSLSIDSLSPQQSQLFSLGTGDSPAATGLPFAPSRNLDDAVEPTQLAMANGPLAAPESTATPASAMTLQTPPTPSAPNFGPSAVSTPQRSAENTDPSSKRRRIGDMTSPLLRSLGATTVLDHYLRQSGGEQSLSAAVERPRFLLLRQACAQEDVFFVALHQLFCVWSRNNSEAHKLCVKGRHDTSLVDNAFGLLGTILKHNSTIRPEHLQWFASFPRPLDHLHSAYPGYAKTLNQVLNCLVRLSSYWMVVNNEHRRLGYPLLVDEMLSVLWLYSPILQTIFFRASRRTLGVLDNPIGTQMDQIFGRDQESHRDANGSFSPRVTTNFQQDPQNAVLITRYLALTRPAMAGRASPQPQVPNSGQQQPERHPNAMPGVRTGLQTTVANGNRSSTAVFDQQHRVVPAASSHDQMMRTQSSHQFAQSPAYATFTSLPGQPPMSQETLNSPIHGHFPIVNTSDSTNVNQGASHLQGGSYVTSSSPPLMSAIVPSQSAPHNYQYAQHQQPPMVRRTSQQFVQISSPRLAQMQQHWTSPQMSNNSNLPSHPQNVITESLQSPSIPVSMLNSSSCGQTATSTDSVSNMSSWVVELNNHHLVLQQQHQQQQLQLQLQQQQRQRQQQQLQQQQQQQDILQRPLPNPTRPVSIQTQSRQPSQSALNTTFARSLSRIGISPADYPHDPYERKSLENSLHQAHLRSPRRVPKNYPTLNPPEKHFQSIKYLALQPTPIPQQQLLHFLNFVIGETDYAKISKDVLVHDDSLPVNMFWDGSLRVRLRCSFKSKGANSFNLSEWVIADTNWPDHIFMQLNDRPLTIKRKQHHHKDQPIEIGAFVRPGMNTLKITVPFAKPIPNGMKPFIAVEIVETLSLSSVRALNNLQPEMVIPVENTKALIQRRLAGSSSHDDDDDEIAMVISDLTINLADPFSYTMFTTPVRGQACTHLECFDLDTWLETRPSKKSCVCGAKQTNCKLCPKEPSLADKWRCPICQADARPFSLRVDGFLVEVRESLLAQDLSKVKEIIVSADGFWRPVIPDDDSDMDGDEFSRPGSSSGPSHPTNAQKTPVEVILLDDD